MNIECEVDDYKSYTPGRKRSEDRSGLCEEAMMKSLCKGIMNARLDGKVTKCIIWRSDWMI